MGFLQQFLDVFSELQGKKLYLSGESVRFISFTIERTGIDAYLMDYLPVRGDVCAV